MGLRKGSISSFEPSSGQNGARKAMLLAEGEKEAKHQNEQTCPYCEIDFDVVTNYMAYKSSPVSSQQRNWPSYRQHVQSSSLLLEAFEMIFHNARSFVELHSTCFLLD